MKELKVSSPAFAHMGKIPSKYTCDGDDVNPPLVIENIPDKARSLVLIMDDPDAPMGTWDHWVVWNIQATIPTTKITENSVPHGAIQGLNDFGKRVWGGPCPPGGKHRYFFKVYALDTKLELSLASRKEDVEKAMRFHILANGELVGVYSRS